MGVVIFIVIAFYLYFRSVKDLTNKINVIKEAKAQGKDTFTDPIKMIERSTETGEAVVRRILSKRNTIPENCQIGDRVLIGVTTGRIYRNYSYDEFMQHIEKQLADGKCWCAERSAFHYGIRSFDEDLKYHIKEKYFYKLKTELTNHKWYYFLIRYNPFTKIYYSPIEINYTNYKKLGGIHTERE